MSLKIPTWFSWQKKGWACKLLLPAGSGIHTGIRGSANLAPEAALFKAISTEGRHMKIMKNILNRILHKIAFIIPGGYSVQALASQAAGCTIWQ